MASNFSIFLDTTSPIVEIYAPPYTSPDITTNITIQANENLATYQEIYIVDSADARHDFTFQYNDYSFMGVVTLNELALGTATIYARVKDVVDNASLLCSKTINIINGQKLIVELNEFSMEVSLDELELHVNIETKQSEVEISVEV